MHLTLLNMQIQNSVLLRTPPRRVHLVCLQSDCTDVFIPSLTPYSYAHLQNHKSPLPLSFSGCHFSAFCATERPRSVSTSGEMHNPPVHVPGSITRRPGQQHDGQCDGSMPWCGGATELHAGCRGVELLWGQGLQCSGPLLRQIWCPGGEHHQNQG